MDPMLLPTQPVPEEKPIDILIAEQKVPIEWRVGDVILDIYEVCDIFTTGGMGNVYRVHHRGWNMDLAVKSPKPELLKSPRSVQNFIRECETWVGLGLHPHVVSCYYVRNLGGIPRIFTEFVEGGSLKDWIDKGKLYEGGQGEVLRRILDIAIQTSWGLQYAHDQGLIHQDVKPANIMLTKDGIAKVTDFGLAKARSIVGDLSPSTEKMTLIASFGGMTPAYCSPEQAAKQLLTCRTDIWSWAVTILEMFAGDIFWMGGQFAGKALEEYRNRQPTNTGFPNIPESIYYLLQECLEIDLESRPATMIDVASKLIAYYPKIATQEYTRPSPKAVQMMADILNNKAVSLIDLGLYHDANKTFDDLLKTNSNHLEGIYNRHLLDWRTGQKTDEQIVREFEALAATFPNNWRIKLYLAYIHIERADKKCALNVLSAIDREPNNSTIVKEAMEKAAKLSDRHSRQVINSNGSTVFKLLPGHWFCLSGWEDNSLRTIDLESGKNIKVFGGFKGFGIQSIVILPNGRTAFSGGEDGRIRQWDIIENRFTRQLEGHIGPVTALAVLGNRILISGGEDGTIKYWDFQTGICTQNIILTDFYRISSMAVSRQGEFIYVGGSKFLVLDANNGEIVREFTWEVRFGSFDNIILSSAICSQRNTAIVGTEQNGVFILDLINGSRRFLQGSDGGAYIKDKIFSVAISPTGKYGLIENHRGLVSLWDLNLDRKLFEFPKWYTTEITFSPDEKYAALGAYIFPLDPFLTEIINNPKMPYQELSSKDSIRKFYRRKSPISEVCFSHDSQIVAIGDKEGYIELWRLGETYGTGELICEVDARKGLGQSEETGFDGHGGKINDISISKDGKWALTASDDNTVRLWNMDHSKCVRVFDHTTNVTSVAISPDGNYGLSGSDYQSPSISLWNLRSGERLQTFEGHKGTISSLAFFNMNNLILSGCSDGSLRIWESTSGSCICVLSGHTKGIKSVVISEDGSFALSGGEDNKLIGWNIPQRKSVFTHEIQGFTISHLALCIEQGICIMGGNDRVICVIKLDTGKCLRTFSFDIYSRILGLAIRDGQSILVSISSSGINDIPLPQFEEMPYQIIRPQSSFDISDNQSQYRGLISQAQKAFDTNEVGRAAELLRKANTIPGYLDSTEWLQEWERVSDRGARVNLEETILLYSLPVTKKGRAIISYDDQYIFMSGEEYQIWDIKQFKQVRKYENWDLRKNIALSRDTFEISPSWNTGLFAGADFKLEHGLRSCLLVLMDLQKWESIQVMEGHIDEIRAISISPDGRYALSGGEDKQIRLWDLITGDCLKVMVGHKESIKYLNFSPDGVFGYSASDSPDEGSIKIWHLEKGTLHHEIRLPSLKGYIEGYSGYVYGLAISENGRYLLVLVNEKVLHIFDLKSDKRIVTITESSTSDRLEKLGIRPCDLFTGSVLNLVMPVYRPELRGYVSPSGKRAVISRDNATQQLVALKWSCEFPSISDWELGAQPYLENFIQIHQPIRKGQIFKNITFTWSKQDFQELLQKLSYCGYGWLRPEGVQRQLEKMARDW